MIRRLVRNTAPLAILGAVFMAPSLAFAQDVAIAPILPKAGVDQKVANNVTSLVSSELDFSSSYEMATELDSKPSSLTLSCLNKASCLKAIGRNAGTDFLVAGSIANAGEEYDLYLVLLDVNQGTYVRKVTRKVDSSPSGLADAMGGVVRELTTGETPGQKADATASVDDFDMFSDEDFDFGSDSSGGRLDTPGNSSASLDDFEDEPDDWELEEQRRRAEEEEARRRAEAEARRKEEDARRRAQEEEARRRADEERRQAEAEARRREEEARRREEAERRRAEEEAAALDDISFGSVDPDDIEVEIDDISFGDASSEIELVDDDPLDYDDYDLDALDDPRDSRSSNSSRDRDYSSSSSDRDRDRDSVSSLDGPGSEATIRGERGANDPRFGVIARAGYAKFQSFDFFTYGAELSIPVGDVFFLDIGLAGYTTQRDVPIIIQNPDGTSSIQGFEQELNTIAPFNFGVKYQPTDRPFRPYIGADVTITPYTVSPNFRMAPGLRARGGFDYMVSSSFGLNVDLSAGFWYGDEFSVVDKDLQPLGGVPSLSLGSIILF
ncbi:MAG: hypothetical protein VX899_03315 [Myxococcota bacterium]|nr:hypothetical protein [Myxococcota bacterium]